MMDRRSFFAIAAAAISLDPDRLLWVPGRRSISIPSARKKELRYFAAEMKVSVQEAIKLNDPRIWRSELVEPLYERLCLLAEKESLTPVNKIQWVSWPAEHAETSIVLGARGLPVLTMATIRGKAELGWENGMPEVVGHETKEFVYRLENSALI